MSYIPASGAKTKLEQPEKWLIWADVSRSESGTLSSSRQSFLPNSLIECLGSALAAVTMGISWKPGAEVHFRCMVSSCPWIGGSHW